jgi:asparagine synthase (glutamine-hydrolysing)
MSGILAVVAPESYTSRPQRLGAVMAALARRGDDHTDLRTWGSCTLGVGRFAWELEPGFSGPVLTASDGNVAVAADASLYYKSDLRRKLAGRGVRPLSDAPAHLILAAYRAWGRECLEHLEGSFALIVWDSDTRTLFAARDFEGNRPLFHAMVGDTLVVASSVRAVLAYPGCPDDLNVVAIAEDAGYLTGSPTETSYRAISRLPGGWNLEFRVGDPEPRASRYWTPPVFADTGSADFEKGAEELRELLSAAVAERFDAVRSTAIALSGGYDSPAIFACGSAVLAGERSSRALRPVSISYPVGDLGREDEKIQEVLSFWRSSTRWIDSTEVPLFGDLVVNAAERDESIVHPFEHMLRRVLSASREEGCRVMLDGHGGDFLFQISTDYFADLFRSGAWYELAREWRASGRRSWRDFVRSAIIPVLSPGAISLLSRVRGRAIHQPGYAMRPARWFRASFITQARLLEREAEHQPPRGSKGWAAFETSSYLTNRYCDVVSQLYNEIGLEVGVERRSPFLDARVIRFAAQRPRWERSSMTETKRLLRRSVAGLLPDQTLARRPFKTGVLHTYVNREMHRLLDSHAELLEAPVLSDLGVVDPTLLRDACERFRANNYGMLATQLLCTFQAEAWLRTRFAAPAARVPAPTALVHADS